MEIEALYVCEVKYTCVVHAVIIVGIKYNNETSQASWNHLYDLIITLGYRLAVIPKTSVSIYI